jgi:hypothetical protein
MNSSLPPLRQETKANPDQRYDRQGQQQSGQRAFPAQEESENHEFRANGHRRFGPAAPELETWRPMYCYNITLFADQQSCLFEEHGCVRAEEPRKAALLSLFRRVR